MGKKMSEKLYYLNYCGERICESITLDNALLMIEALCRKYYKESSHKFELVELEPCMVNPEKDSEGVLQR